MIPIIKPNLGEFWDNIEPTLRTIAESGHLSGGGPFLDKFEADLCMVAGADHAVALSSCTSGLMLVLQALGASGREVILPSFTFLATAHAAKWCGCKIVFADIDDTFCIDPADVESKITDQTAAIIGVHMYGLPCDVERLGNISYKHEVPVIYDAAHALGAKANDNAVGVYGEANVYSFSPTKLLTTLEGGAVVTNNADLAAELRLDRNYSCNPDYTCDRVGLSARLDEMRSAIGSAQMKLFEYTLLHRRQLAASYRFNLSNVPGISFQYQPMARRSANKDVAIIIDPDEYGMDRDDLSAKLHESGVQTKKYFYPPCHKLAAYAGEHPAMPVTDKISERVLCLPIHNRMEPDECFAVSDLIANAKRGG